MLKQGTEIEGRYVVEAKLGEGGLAAVYRVRHGKLGTLYALKLLKRDGPKIRRRLLREGELQSKLRHPNIAAVVDQVDVDGVPGLVMEYVRGASLEELLDDEALSLDQVDHLVEGVFRGVAAAHDAGTIHRDLKPANVLLEVVDGVLVPKITDFGLAKALDGYSETAVGAMMGSPQYMAPEQIEDASSVGPKADVFSLGVMLYEMTSGERPFEAPTVADVLKRVLDNDRRPIVEVAPHLPQHKLRAIERALAADPDQRPDVLDLLTQWRGGDWRPADAVPFTSSLVERAVDRGEGTGLPAVTEPGPTTAPAAVAETFQDPQIPIALASSAGRRRWWLVGLVGAVVAGIGLVAVLLTTGSLAFLLGRGTGGSIRADTPDLPVAPQTPIPAMPDPSPPTPEPVEPVPVAEPADPELVVPRPSAPKPVPVAPSPAPVAPEPPSTGSVRIVGDARRALLVGPSGPVEMGAVEPGEYQVWASFADEAPTEASTQPIVVRAGEELTVSCSSVTVTCAPER